MTGVTDRGSAHYTLEASAADRERSIVALPPPARGHEASTASDGDDASGRRRSTLTLLALFVVVLVAELAFGLWTSAMGFRPPDGISRAVNAMTVLHPPDPHLAAIGFVWMPLPTFIELVWMPAYPLWPQLISSGFASVFTTSLAAATAAALLLLTARRFGLSDRFGVAFALLVVLNPMLFLYGANGMSEGVAAPALIGSVCALTLYWQTGRRRYVALAGIALALAFASLYEAVHFGAALGVALVAGVLWDARSPSQPRERRSAARALFLVLVLPPTYVGFLWVAANAVIMGDPLYFATSSYSNLAQTEAADAGEQAFATRGQVLEVLAYVAERSAYFLIPVAALLLVRAMEGRLRTLKTTSLILLTVSVPVGLFAPLLFLGVTFGWLRFFMYPLFVAAGWGLYEIAASRRRRRATAVILASWVLAIPAAFAAMAHPRLGEEENLIVKGLVSGQTGPEVGFYDQIEDMRPVSRFLQMGPLREGEWVALDQFAGFPVPAQIPREQFKHLLLTPDRAFDAAIRDFAGHGVRYVLVPSPENTPQDAILRVHPRLWSGQDPAFELVRAFPDTAKEWRLYRVRGHIADRTAVDRARARAAQ